MRSIGCQLLATPIWTRLGLLGLRIYVVYICTDYTRVLALVCALVCLSSYTVDFITI